LLKVDVDYPRGNEDFEILRRMSVDPPTAEQVLDPSTVLKLQDMASNIFVHNLVAEYIVRLVLATRNPADFGMPDLDNVISIGCSPRATLGLVAASRALALIHGRDYVLPTDVQSVAKDVMAHRLVLGFDAVADNVNPIQVVERIIAMVPPPTPVWKDNRQSRPTAPARNPASFGPPQGPTSVPPGHYSAPAPGPTNQQPPVPMPQVPPRPAGQGPSPFVPPGGQPSH
jgi:MoxR-like ATPase